MPRAWRWLSIADRAGVDRPCGARGAAARSRSTSIVLGLTAGILVPVWAIWLAMRARDVFGDEAPAG